MKNKILLLLSVLSVSVATFTGCKSSPTVHQQEVVTDLLHFKAQAVASGALWYRPQLLTAFQLAQKQLESLATNGSINVADITGIFDGLKLTGTLPRIVHANFQELLKLISTAGSGSGGAANQAWLKLITAALASGLKDGIELAVQPVP